MIAPDVPALTRLVERLDLETLGDDHFRGLLGAGRGRVFGGMVAAQALVAAGRTVEDGFAHSVHVHFLRPGRHRLPIDWLVTRLRDGRALALRQVVGKQQNEIVATMTVSFATSQDGLAHQDPMPVVPPPEGLPDSDDLKATIFGRVATSEVAGPLELRECDPPTALPAVGTPARRALWIRPRGKLPDDPLLHTAVLLFASDRALLSTAGRPHGLVWTPLVGASLDHTVWLHGPVRVDGWLLVANESPVAAGGRALILGAIYTPDGTRIASVAQEGIIRDLSARKALAAQR
jgi:acyl-CoA thioesterase-2